MIRPRQYPSGSIGSLIAGEWPPPANESASAMLFRRLGLSFESADDPDTTKVVERLDRVTADWPKARRAEAGLVVESIVRAENALQAWEPKRVRPAFHEVAVAAVQSARTAETMIRSFPEPRMLAIGAVIRELIDFALDAFDESILVEPELALYDARKAIQKFRADESLDPISNLLITDLVLIVRGKRPRADRAHGDTFDESTLRRRYIRPRKETPRSPAAAEWQKAWPLMRRISKISKTFEPFSSEERRASLREVIRQRLDLPLPIQTPPAFGNFS